MPTPAVTVTEILLHVPFVAVVGAGVYWLKRNQPDPNPGPELARAQLQALEGEERRRLQMPYVGIDRRRQGAHDAAAWRRAA